MFSKTGIALLALGLVRAQCPQPTVFTDYSATTSVTVGTFTQAQVSNPSGQPQDITVTECGDATVSPSATVTVESGRVVVAGTFIPPPVNTITKATAYVRGTATIPQASYGHLIVLPTGSVTVEQAGWVTLSLRSSASASFSASSLFVDMDPGATATLTAGNGNVYATGAVVDMQFGALDGQLAIANGYESARVQARGTSIQAYVDTGAHATVYGSENLCFAYYGGSCTAMGASQTHWAGDGGYAEVVTGTGNRLIVEPTGSALIGGQQNYALVSSGGALQMTDAAAATILESGVATVSSGVNDVTVSSGGTATMYAGATLTAPAGAQLRVLSPQTTIASVSEFDACTIYVARALATGGGAEPGRRALPVPTGRCNTGSQGCPDLRGVFHCVDTSRDIFNCGGCALSGAGVDCTQQFDADVRCVEGQCVAA